jgi:hypothetical protein
MFNFNFNFNFNFYKKFQSWQGRSQAVNIKGLAAPLPNLECKESFFILNGD